MGALEILFIIISIIIILQLLRRALPQISVTGKQNWKAKQLLNETGNAYFQPGWDVMWFKQEPSTW